MFRRAWRIGVIVSFLWVSQPATTEPIPEQDALVQAASAGLPDAAADEPPGWHRHRTARRAECRATLRRGIWQRSRWWQPIERSG